MKKKLFEVVIPLAVAGGALGTPGVVNASGFALSQQGVKQVGSAIAGGAATAEDASTIFFNPAGMTHLRGAHAVVGGHILSPSAEFSGSATTYEGEPIGGGDGGNAGFIALIPILYYSHELNEDMWVGIGMGVPFGLATDYERSWAGRYHAVKTDLATFNINPSAAYKLNDKLSLGAGLNLMYASAELSNAVDYSAACLSQAPELACDLLGMGTPGDRSTDGHVAIEGDSWGYGFNLGLLYDMTEQTRIGIAYRSKVVQKIKGRADFTEPTGPWLIPPPFTSILADGGVTATVDMPATFSVSVITQVAPKWEVMFDFTSIQWSSFEELRIKFDNPETPDSVQPENWENSSKISVGFNYRHSAEWTFRGGFAIDQSPIPGVDERTPRIPDNNRKWIAGGFTYTASPKLSLDFALAHLFVGNTGLDSTDESFGHQLEGSYELGANIISTQANWKF
jgi:long-chain fatty acid transport protein